MGNVSSIKIKTYCSTKIETSFSLNAVKDVRLWSVFSPILSLNMIPYCLIKTMVFYNKWMSINI